MKNTSAICFERILIRVVTVQGNTRWIGGSAVRPLIEVTAAITVLLGRPLPIGITRSGGEEKDQNYSECRSDLKSCAAGAVF